jgi:hypothetical protein
VDRALVTPASYRTTVSICGEGSDGATIAKSDVQFGQRFAALGIDIVQYGHAFVLSVTGAGFA